MNKIDDKIIIVLKKVFPKTKKIKNLKKLQINDIKEWDSIGNLNLLLAIEKDFKIKFSIDEMAEIKSIKQILKKINANKK
jgi:acyl carrier protein